ncbi:hypothetical protein B0T20DRAFT_226730 [Sordaria brevicollis]|uniref:Uncharacterized protein n=1 Tax=Sordaria brevicollis TaxID=83679 RepID=A0AAE0PD63_SORBR|nr:hypothetical protein B0T20DRAFT_226730 [Sordaria brevicollis]
MLALVLILSDLFNRVYLAPHARCYTPSRLGYFPSRWEPGTATSNDTIQALALASVDFDVEVPVKWIRTLARCGLPQPSLWPGVFRCFIPTMGSGRHKGSRQTYHIYRAVMGTRESR